MRACVHVWHVAPPIRGDPHTLSHVCSVTTPQEFYDADDLLFFLHVRSVVQKELGINFRSHWAEVGRGPERNPRTSFLSHRECQVVSRVVFGSETDPLFKAFMNVVERHVVGQRRGKSDTRRIEVMQFLHLALSEYHAMSPAEGGADSDAQAAPGAPAAITSREEQERLFREAEAQYNESIRNSHTDDEDARRSRIEAMEASLRSKMADGVRCWRRVCVLSRAVADLTREMWHDQTGLAPAYPAGNSADAAPSAVAAPAARQAATAPRVPDRELLKQLGQAMHEANEAYLGRVMQSGSNLPPSLLEQIKEEVRAELESKVDAVLATVINKTGAGDAEEIASDPLAHMFNDVLASGAGGGSGTTVADFAAAVVEDEQVRNDIEPLVALLFTYANSRIEEKGSGGAANES